MLLVVFKIIGSGGGGAFHYCTMHAFVTAYMHTCSACVHGKFVEKQWTSSQVDSVDTITNVSDTSFCMLTRLDYFRFHVPFHHS